MKKKLQLNELKVKSFVTSESKAVKGGSVTDITEGGTTKYSCYRNISCAAVMCYVRTIDGPICQ